MKIIALILSLNILISTNGIAISERFCSKMDTPQKEVSSNYEQSDNCCHTNYIGFSKQDIEGFISSSVILKKVFQDITLINFMGIYIPKTEYLENLYFEHPPPKRDILFTKSDPAFLQVFRC